MIFFPSNILRIQSDEEGLCFKNTFKKYKNKHV